MFPNALVMLALDERDETLLRALAAGASGLGVRRLVACHLRAVPTIPEPLARVAGVVDQGPPPALAAAVDRLRGLVPDAEVVGTHAAGEPREEIARLVRDEAMDLLIMGRDRHMGGRSALGRSGLKLLRSAACSVLVVPDGTDLQLQRALVGMDFSSNAVEGLKAAVGCFADVEALFQYDSRAAGSPAVTDEGFHDAFAENVRSHFDGVVRPVLPEGAAVRLSVVEGKQAHDVLIDHTQGRVIVVGSRGMTAMAAQLLGSVAETLAGEANTPVLIWRKKGEQLGFIQALVHR